MIIHPESLESVASKLKESLTRVGFKSGSRRLRDHLLPFWRVFQTVMMISAGLGVVACASKPEVTFGADARSVGAAIQVLPVRYDQNIRVQNKRWGGIGITQFYLFGWAGLAVDFTIDKLHNTYTRDVQSKHAERLNGRERLVDLTDLSARIGRRLQFDAEWRPVVSVDSLIDLEAYDAAVLQRIQDPAVNALVTLEVEVSLTPKFDHLRVAVRQRTPKPCTSESADDCISDANSRVFTFYSPRHTPNRRVPDAAVRAYLIADLEGKLAELRELRPDSNGPRMRYKHRMLRQLEDLKSGEGRLPFELAVLSTWSQQRIAEYIDGAIQQLARMIAWDWSQDEVPQWRKSESSLFRVFDERGSLTALRGLKLFDLDNQKVYQSSSGSLYSIPPSLQRKAQ